MTGPRSAGRASGKAAPCGAVAQLLKNARQVTVAIRRMDTLAFSDLMELGRCRRLAMIAKNYSRALFLRVRP